MWKVDHPDILEWNAAVANTRLRHVVGILFAYPAKDALGVLGLGVNIPHRGTTFRIAVAGDADEYGIAHGRIGLPQRRKPVEARRLEVETYQHQRDQESGEYHTLHEYNILLPCTLHFFHHHHHRETD